MCAHENFDVGTSSSAINSFALLTRTPTHKNIPAPEGQTTLPDGSKVVANEKGELIYVSYSEGSTMMRFEDYVVCSNVLSDHWFRNRKMEWMRLD